MESGFLSYKDVLEVIVIPLTLAILTVLFPAIKSWYIRKRFKKLILRELQEISPYPESAEKGNSWASHLQKRCIHEEIFKNSTENRDFILSLPPDLVYNLSNLWDPQNLEDFNGEQWKFHLGELNNYFKDKSLQKVYDNWVNLLAEYKSIDEQK